MEIWGKIEYLLIKRIFNQVQWFQFWISFCSSCLHMKLLLSFPNSKSLLIVWSYSSYFSKSFCLPRFRWFTPSPYGNLRSTQRLSQSFSEHSTVHGFLVWVVGGCCFSLPRLFPFASWEHSYYRSTLSSYCFRFHCDWDY